MQRLNDLLDEKSLEKNSLVKELRISRRNTIDPQAEITITSPKATASVNTYAKKKMLEL
jgi:hypothetical protein